MSIICLVSTKSIIAQTANPRASRMEAATKTIWKAFKDISLLRILYLGTRVRASVPAGAAGHLLARPNDEIHQPSKKESGGQKDGINSFALGHQVHEIAGDEKSLDAGDKQRDANRDRDALEMPGPGINRDACADQQRQKNADVNFEMFADVVVSMRAHS